MRLSYLLMSAVGALLAASSAMAGTRVFDDDVSLASPGALGLVALGVIGAILVARRSK